MNFMNDRKAKSIQAKLLNEIRVFIIGTSKNFY